MKKPLLRDLTFIVGFALCAWLSLALLFGDDIVMAYTKDTHIIAWVMALGSFIAGATCLGGGAVAFPALTKLMAVDPYTAKTFSLAIQSAGMTSASIFILLSVKQLPWRFMSLYMLASLIGLLTSLHWLDPLLATNDIRIGFTLFCLSFLCVFILANQREKLIHKDIDTHTSIGQLTIMSFGLVGGLASGLLGSGADLLAFCALAIYFRMTIRIATQVSVLMMTATSIAGIGFQGLVLDSIPPLTKDLWLAAVPVVVLGAPLGALMCKYIAQKLLFTLVIVLVACEVLTTLWLIPVDTYKIKFYAMLFFATLIGLFISHWYPHKRAKHQA